MITANNRLLQSETSNVSGAVSSTISSSTSHGSTSAASTDVVSSGSHVSQFANSLSEEKKNSYYGQQPPAGFGQLQSSTQSLLSSPYQQQQQHIGLGSLGLSHSSNATTTNHTSVSTQNSTIISTGNMSYLSSSAGYSVPPPSTQPSNLSGVSGQIQYNQYGSGRGNNSESAGSMSYPAYNHHHQFPTKSYAEKQPSSTLNFENTSNTANLYHQQSPYNQSSNYPGSNAGVSNSGMYLGGGVSGANSYMPSNNANSENVFHQSQSEIMRGYQFRSGEVSSFQPRESSGHQSSSTNLSTQQTNKLVSEMTKLSLKDGASSSTSGSNNQYDIVSSMISAASLTTATNTTSSANNLATSITSNSSSLPTSSPSSSTSKSSITQLPGGTKSNTQTNASKQMMNYQGGVNYMISQPPGFPMAPFAYPHSQQALSQYGYDDVQLQSQRFNGGTPYYDYQSASGLQGRGEQQLSASGADSKLALEATQTVGSNLQQPASGSANQQFHTFQPGFGYYYPNQGIMPYYSMIPMSGMGGMQAVPMATNPAHQGSVPSSQYQQKQGNVYGSHPFNIVLRDCNGLIDLIIGGQSQDFTKAFNNPQSAMTTKSATGGNHGDMLLTSGAAGFSKQHVQGFDKSNYHGGTPPPSFNISVPVCTQTGGPGGGQAMYGGGPYIPMMSHPNHTQMIHHHTMVAQDHSLGARGGVGTGGVAGGSGGNSAAQQKVGPNKQQYNNPPYWSAGN
ncbi:hypothetical protein HELRODRAFT_175011 [Helobdella robusta]|uniref:Uncharacterized protein n=1 Tax=Helobdella robusta TaxID=6412 RepID=T1F8Q3_HELRO|nr:hypothetical protein HELRODRAFT_175011 [Helobdella robusta]ESO01452.1 hypothetical protein HELRODRAFT_175011 [Helobdella robusta]